MVSSFADPDFSSGHELGQQGENQAQSPGGSRAPGSEMPVLGRAAGLVELPTPGLLHLTSVAIFPVASSLGDERSGPERPLNAGKNR